MCDQCDYDLDNEPEMETKESVTETLIGGLAVVAFIAMFGWKFVVGLLATSLLVGAIYK